MAYPNLAPVLVVAYCRSDGANPASLEVPFVNVANVLRNEQGRYTVTFGPPGCDVTQRFSLAWSDGFPNVFPSSQDPNGQSDTTCRFAFQTTAGAAVDIPWQFVCLRTVIL